MHADSEHPLEFAVKFALENDTAFVVSYVSDEERVDSLVVEPDFTPFDKRSIENGTTQVISLKQVP